jgi:multicomponent Na+:H+ antiporter subunit E
VFFFAKRFILFAGLWLVLTGAAPGDLAVGILAAAAAAIASLAVMPPGRRRVRATAVLALAPGFLLGSLRGGIDVARRAFHPAMPLNPGWIAWPSRLPPGLARVSLGSELSLMPGTLAAGGDDRVLYVHCLDRDQPVDEAIAAEESRIASTLDGDPPDV